MSLYKLVIREALNHTKLEALMLREIDRLTEEVKELQQAVKDI